MIAGSVLLRLSATPGPDSSWLRTLLRLGCSFLITPHTFSLHTSGVLESMGRDERAAAAGRVLSEWLADHGQAVVPEPLVRQVRRTGAAVCALPLIQARFWGRGAGADSHHCSCLAVPQLVSTGRSALSSSRMKGHGEQLVVSSLNTPAAFSVFDWSPPVCALRANSVHPTEPTWVAH